MMRPRSQLTYYDRLTSREYLAHLGCAILALVVIGLALAAVAALIQALG